MEIVLWYRYIAIWCSVGDLIFCYALLWSIMLLYNWYVKIVLFTLYVIIKQLVLDSIDCTRKHMYGFPKICSKQSMTVLAISLILKASRYIFSQNSLTAKNIRFQPICTVEVKLLYYYISVRYMVFICRPYVRPTSTSHIHVIFTHNTGNCHLNTNRLFRLAFLCSAIACPLIICSVD